MRFDCIRGGFNIKGRCGARGGNRGSGFLGNTGPDRLKITKLPSQNSMLGHHRHASETSFKFRWPAQWYLDLPSPHKLKIKTAKNNVFLVTTPLTKLSGSAHVRWQPTSRHSLTCYLMKLNDSNNEAKTSIFRKRSKQPRYTTINHA